MSLNAIPAMLSRIPRVLRGVDLCDLERMKAITRKAYPSGAQLSIETFAEWMRTSTSLLLVDVRSREELAVSHLHAAVAAVLAVGILIGGNLVKAERPR